MKPRRAELLEQVLNAPYPGEAISEVLKAGGFTGRRKQQMEAWLQAQLDTARHLQIPLGNNLGECVTPEDAYLVRQRYLSGLCQQEIFSPLFRNTLIMLCCGIITVLLALFMMG